MIGASTSPQCAVTLGVDHVLSQSQAGRTHRPGETEPSTLGNPMSTLERRVPCAGLTGRWLQDYTLEWSRINQRLGRH